MDDWTMSIEGLTTIPSSFGPEETATRLEAALGEKGAAVLARIDHAAAAAQAGLTLGPTLLLIFGNPRVGTALMQAKQTMGIDLPLKALVWQDASGKTWVSYNDPAWLAGRHGIAAEVHPALERMSGGLAAIAAQATGTAPGQAP
jgi:uncharacterized protein (DUF302 family)